MADTLAERTEETSDRIWGIFYHVSKRLGVSKDDMFMAEFPIKKPVVIEILDHKREKEEVVGVAQHVDFKKKEDRDALLAVFQEANKDGVARIEIKDEPEDYYPYQVRIMTSGNEPFCEENAYFKMDSFAKSALSIEPKFE